MLALSWILSGLLSMNPAGLLEGSGPRTERKQLLGTPVTVAQVRAALRSLSTLHPPNVVLLRLVPLDGKVFFELMQSTGQRQRIDAVGRPAPLSSAELHFIGTTLAGASQAGPTVLEHEDAYYFAHHGERAELPVLRVIEPETATYYYVDAVTGVLLGKFDSGARGYRWWHQGLHRLDFTAALRRRPLWDALMLVLLTGATGICATGTWLGVRRLLGRGRQR
jgi:hypothetical protein